MLLGESMILSTTEGLKWVEEEIRFSCGSNELFGVLTLPQCEGLYPAVVLLHGSDRKGVDSPRYVNHSHQLVQSGFAVLRYDSPGVGRSPGSIVGETFEYRTKEAISAVKNLQSRDDVMSNMVGLWGISQGGWICQMAAASYNEIAFIIPVSGPGVTVAEQEVYRAEMQSRAAGFSEEEVEKAVLMRRLLVDVFLTEPLYKTLNDEISHRLGKGHWQEMSELVYACNTTDLSVELNNLIKILNSIKDEGWTEFLYINEILKMAKSLSPAKWGEIKASYRGVMMQDPRDYLTKVKCPVLAIFGEADKVVPVARSVDLYKQYLTEAGNTSFKTKVFPGANHQIEVDGEPANGYYELMRSWLRSLST